MLDKIGLAFFTGSEIVPSWSPMRLKILHWRPEFDNWSPIGDQLFRRDRQSYHCKIYVNFDFQKQQFQIKLRSSSQQLTLIFNLTRFCNKILMERDFLYNCHNRTAYDRKESTAIFQRFPITYRGRTSDHVLSVSMNIY